MVRDEYLFEAFRLCLRHKASSLSAIKYRYGFEEDLIHLCDEINRRTYHPATSTTFVVTSPKYREVFAACFRDRIVHHYIAMRLEPLMEEMFSDRTFNCRKGKGVLYGINMLKNDLRECSENYTKDCWIMKLDLQGFFMSIDKALLNRMLQEFIDERYFGEDKDDIKWLTEVVVMHEPQLDCIRRSPDKFWDHLPKNKSLFSIEKGHGLPIGNLSSQHNANFLLHNLDMLIEKLGFKYHGRYVDDFYIIHTDKRKMLESVPIIRRWLSLYLRIKMHPKKFYIQHYSKGVTFTGAIVKYGRVYPAKRSLRNFTNSVMRLNEAKKPKDVEKCISSVNSYLGLMVHMDSYGIRKKVLSMMSEETWGKVYIKGHYQSVHMRRNWKKSPAPKEGHPKIYYAREL